MFRNWLLSWKFLLIISEQRRETRCEASRRSTQRASCYSHRGKPNNSITCEKLILAIWFIEQKVIISRCGTNIRDEPSRPEPAMMLFDASYIRTYGSRGLWIFTQCWPIAKICSFEFSANSIDYLENGSHLHEHWFPIILRCFPLISRKPLRFQNLSWSQAVERWELV